MGRPVADDPALGLAPAELAGRVVRVFELPEIVALPVMVNVAGVVPPVRVNPVDCDVGVNPFIVVTLAAPSVGDVKTGEVAKTIFPLPVVAFPSAVTVPDVGKVRAVAADNVIPMV